MTETVIHHLKSLNQEFKYDLDQGQNKIAEYCDKLRYEVFAATESAIEHLNKLNDNLIKSINEYEKELLDSFEARSKSKDDKLVEWQKLTAQSEELIRKYELTQAEDDMLKEKASGLIDEIEAAATLLRDEYIFNDNHMHFIEMDSFFASTNRFGFLQKTQVSTVRKAKRSVMNVNHQIRRLAILSDGNLAIGLADGRVQLWNPEDGQESICDFKAHQSTLLSIAALQNGEFATGSFDGSLIVWRIERQPKPKAHQVIQKYNLGGHKGSINSMTPLPDGNLVSGSSDGMVKVWDLTTGTLTSDLSSECQKNVICTAVLSDSFVVAAGQGALVNIWNLKTGKVESTIDTNTSGVADIIYLKDGTLLTNSFDKTMKIWDVDEGRCLRSFKPTTHFFRSFTVLASGDLAMGMHDGTVKVWSPVDGSTKRIFIGHQHPVSSTACFKDGTMVSVSTSSEIKLWSLCD